MPPGTGLEDIASVFFSLPPALDLGFLFVESLPWKKKRVDLFQSCMGWRFFSAASVFFPSPEVYFYNPFLCLRATYYLPTHLYSTLISSIPQQCGNHLAMEQGSTVA